MSIRRFTDDSKPALQTQLIAFAVWALSCDGIPEAAVIQHRYGVSRATSYRWHNALTQAIADQQAGTPRRCGAASRRTLRQ